jgi:hypothetical protein
MNRLLMLAAIVGGAMLAAFPSEARAQYCGGYGGYAYYSSSYYPIPAYTYGYAYYPQVTAAYGYVPTTYYGYYGRPYHHTSFYRPYGVGYGGYGLRPWYW